MNTHIFIHLYYWCHELTHREVKMGKIPIVALFIFILHVSLGMEIDVCVGKDWTEVKGNGSLWSFVRCTFHIYWIIVECITIIKLCIILVCIVTMCIDPFIDILVIYVIQFSSDVLQMLVQELQDLFTHYSNFDYDVTSDFRSLLSQRIQQPMQEFPTLVILFFLDVQMSLFIFLFLLKSKT